MSDQPKPGRVIQLAHSRPVPNLRNIADGLRRLADGLENGEIDADNVVLAFTFGNQISQMHSFGDHRSYFEVIGILGLARAYMENLE